MMWPDILGGGYHYMMINGKWKNENNVTDNFAFHLGIGQLYKSNVIDVDSIYAFVQNYFYVKLQVHERILLLISAFLLIMPTFIHSLIGALLLGVVVALQLYRSKRQSPAIP